jgi:hypothetical protein
MDSTKSGEKVHGILKIHGEGPWTPKNPRRRSMDSTKSTEKPHWRSSMDSMEKEKVEIDFSMENEKVEIDFSMENEKVEIDFSMENEKVVIDLSAENVENALST